MRRDVAHLQVVALQRHQLGALAEQRGVQEHLDLEIGLDVLGQHLHHVGADVLVREHGGKAQGGLGLRPGGHHRCGGERSAGLQHRAAVEMGVHGESLLLWVVKENGKHQTVAGDRRCATARIASS
ncbi:hypothetical protein D9M68_956090 [compost metagenome]